MSDRVDELAQLVEQLKIRASALEEALSEQAVEAARWRGLSDFFEQARDVMAQNLERALQTLAELKVDNGSE